MRCGIDAEVGHNVFLPDHAPVRPVDRMQPAGGSGRVDHALADRRRGPRPHAAEHRLVPRGHAHSPLRLARGDCVAAHDLLVAALLERHGMLAIRHDPAPAGADRPPPELARWPRGPVGIERGLCEAEIASRAQEPGEVCGRRLPGGRVGRGRSGRPRREQAIPRRGPPPDELRHEIARHAFDAEHARGHDDRPEQSAEQHLLERGGVAAFAHEPEQKRHERREHEDQRDDVAHRLIDDAAHDRLEQPGPHEHRRRGERCQRHEHPPRRPERAGGRSSNRAGTLSGAHDTEFQAETGATRRRGGAGRAECSGRVARPSSAASMHGTAFLVTARALD